MTTAAAKQGDRFNAVLQLGSWEAFATNAMIRSRLERLGFKNVSVVGRGREREVWGTWSGPDTIVELPKQVRTFRLIQPPQ